MQEIQRFKFQMYEIGCSKLKSVHMIHVVQFWLIQDVVQMFFVVAVTMWARIFKKSATEEVENEL